MAKLDLLQGLSVGLLLLTLGACDIHLPGSSEKDGDSAQVGDENQTSPADKPSSSQEADTATNKPQPESQNTAKPPQAKPTAAKQVSQPSAPNQHCANSAFKSCFAEIRYDVLWHTRHLLEHGIIPYQQQMQEHYARIVKLSPCWQQNAEHCEDAHIFSLADKLQHLGQLLANAAGRSEGINNAQFSRLNNLFQLQRKMDDLIAEIERDINRHSQQAPPREQPLSAQAQDVMLADLNSRQRSLTQLRQLQQELLQHSQAYQKQQQSLYQQLESVAKAVNSAADTLYLQGYLDTGTRLLDLLKQLFAAMTACREQREELAQRRECYAYASRFSGSATAKFVCPSLNPKK